MWTTFSIEGLVCNQARLNDEDQTILGFLLVLTGFVACLLNGWLVGCLFLKFEFHSQNHLLMMNMMIACLGHNLLAGFPFQGTSAISKRWLFGRQCCEFFAFLDKFFTIVEVFASILMILERFCTTQLDKIGNKFYFYSVLSSWIVSSVFASLPLFIVSRFICDAAGISCDLDWQPKNQEDQLYFGVYTIILALPGLIICGLVMQDYYQERKYNMKIGDNQITKSVTVMVLLMQFSWIPSGLVSLYTLMNFQIPSVLVFMAPIFNTISTVIPFMTIFVYNQEIRNKLIGTLHRRQGLKMRRLPMRNYRRNPSPSSIIIDEK